MAFKFNKEMLLKQRFWVMLAASVCLALTGIFYLELLVDADETIKGIKTKMDGAKSLKGPWQNDKAIEVRAKDAERAQKSESEIWLEAFKKQEPVYKWAQRVEEEFDYYNGRFANEIKLLKMTSSKDWPADSATLIHGTLEEQGPSIFKLKTRTGGLLTFYRTLYPNVEKPTVVDTSKTILYNEMLANSKGRYLAVKFQTGKYFGDMLTGPELLAFAESYKDQIHPILKLVDPLTDKGTGVVQLKNWLYKPDAFPEVPDGPSLPFIRYVTKEWNKARDFSKEAWIAQENLWIQREIYEIIKKTNESISNFQRKDGKGEEMKGKEAEQRDKPYTFTNSYFELELVLHKNDSISFTIKNRMERRQRLDLSFSLQMNNQPGMKPEIIKISGLPLMPQGDKGGKDIFVQTIPPSKETVRMGIYRVKQVLTWETAAIKRIDQISIGSNAPDDIAHSQRTYYDNLRPFDVADIGAPDGGVAVVFQPKLKGPGGFDPRKKGPAIAGGGANVGVLEHGLWRDRYVEVTEQSRRIPVAVVLIVDQDHVDRVLTTFNNSRLRFLETQVLLNHYGGSLQPPAAEPKDGPGVNPNPFKFGSGFPGTGPREGPKGPGGQPQPGADIETNMEMVIYGIMTLYQRYPPRPAIAVEKK